MASSSHAPALYSYTKTVHHDIYPSIDPTKSDLSQPSKVVLITGSGRGIGRSTALRYAESGVSTIILCARTSSELDEVEKAIKTINSNVNVRKAPVDITDEAEVVALAKDVREKVGRLDALINNAGISENWVPIVDSDADEYWRTWTVHIKGTYLMLKNFLPLLTETASNTSTIVDIINMSSIGAHRTFPSASAYQTSKLALLRLTEFVQAEYATEGVNCIAMHPGGVLTEMGKSITAIRAGEYHV
jgi:NAD(P)-dependent dehydrogenase (short-subunit alcohol dehydrogenase family)